MSICDSHEFHRLGFFSPRSSACPLFSQHSPETSIFIHILVVPNGCGTQPTGCFCLDGPCDDSDDRWKALLEKINQGAPIDPAKSCLWSQGSSKDHPRIIKLSKHGENSRPKTCHVRPQKLHPVAQTAWPLWISVF